MMCHSTSPGCASIYIYIYIYIGTGPAHRHLCRKRTMSSASPYIVADGHIAQWLERLTADQQVPGSIPGVPSCVACSACPGAGRPRRMLGRGRLERGRLVAGAREVGARDYGARDAELRRARGRKAGALGRGGRGWLAVCSMAGWLASWVA